MTRSRADALLHPVRMKIIQAFITGGMQTPLQLAEFMGNIPQATMYRHLNQLVNAGILEVVAERKNRGTIEKVYTLAPNGSDLQVNDYTETSADVHMEMFQKFVGLLIGDFGSYLDQEHYHLLQDGVSFRQVQLNLNDEEYSDLLQTIREQMQKYAGNQPGDGRRLRKISTIVTPEADMPPVSSSEMEKGSGQHE
ncbi:helix-turn-helix domain-containing protein [Gorillibacterium massiliense]|uniref:helix-turn-helix domain-containing protein n=1 Tax=Gorillibacterium massiliense TaxID=1280390 RepID=UPI0004ADD167|nr:helix-turn-helix domain-containing protein [Gorillibacterium massiliense]